MNSGEAVEEIGAVTKYEEASDLDENLFILSEQESIPSLASQEPFSSDWESEGTNFDNNDFASGMTEGLMGNVTNLCRRRNHHIIREGVVTKTGQFISVSLGFSLEESSEGDWAEVIDDEEHLRGMNRRCFRLKIVDGRTESIDEE